MVDVTPAATSAVTSNTDQLLPILAVSIIAVTFIIILMIINNVRETTQASNKIRRYISGQKKVEDIDMEDLLIREEEDKSVEETVIRLLPTLEPLRDKFIAANINLKLSYYVIINLCITLCLVALNPIPALPQILQPILYLLVCHLIASEVILKMLVEKNKNKMRQQLPSALDMIVRSLQVGQTVDTSIRQTSLDLDDPLGIHFRKIVEDLSLGVPLGEAISQTANRIDLKEFDLFAIAIRVQLASGGNLAHALESISNTIRQRHNLRLKIQALAAEGKVSAWVIGLLPVGLFAYFNIASPEYVQILYDDPRGTYILGGAVGLLALGIFFILKIIKIKI